MKAKEYYDKYANDIMRNNTFEAAMLSLKSMYDEFNREMVDICNVRHCATDLATAAVIREQNQKWNALERRFRESNEGLSPIKRDGFKEFWIKQLPTLQYLI